MEAKEIAPCGINCAVCGRYRRKRNGCDGCRERAERKSVICSMKNCQNEARADASTCAGCGKLPCRRVRGFNERYLRVTAGYVSVVENLRRIEADGMDAFLRAEEKMDVPRLRRAPVDALVPLPSVRRAVPGAEREGARKGTEGVRKTPCGAVRTAFSL